MHDLTTWILSWCQLIPATWWRWYHAQICPYLRVRGGRQLLEFWEAPTFCNGAMWTCRQSSSRVEVEQGEVSEEVEPGARRPHRRRGWGRPRLQRAHDGRGRRGAVRSTRPCRCRPPIWIHGVIALEPACICSTWSSRARSGERSWLQRNSDRAHGRLQLQNCQSRPERVSFCDQSCSVWQVTWDQDTFLFAFPFHTLPIIVLSSHLHHLISGKQKCCPSDQ